jgi:hypothetical protein
MGGRSLAANPLYRMKIKFSRSGSPIVAVLLFPLYLMALLLSIPLMLLSLLDPKSWRFDKQEARELLRNHLDSFKSLSSDEIRQRLADPMQHCVMVKGQSGTTYQVEVQAHWDRSRGEVQLLGGIDDGRFRAFFPLSDSVIFRPAENTINKERQGAV